MSDQYSGISKSGLRSGLPFIQIVALKFASSKGIPDYERMFRFDLISIYQPRNMNITRMASRLGSGG